MNTTLKQIIYNLKNLKQAGRQSQDALLSDMQYAFIVDYYRGILVNRELENKRMLSSVLEQTLKVSFTRATVDQDVFQDKRVYIAKLPSVVHSNDRPLYTAVRKSMFLPSISRSTTQSIRHDLNSPTTSNFMRYFPEEMNLYIVTPKPLEEMFVTAIFEHPLEVELWKVENGQDDKDNPFDPYDPYNFEYPMPLKHLDALYKAMREGEITFSMLAPNDIKADGMEERISQQQAKSKPSTTVEES